MKKTTQKTMLGGLASLVLGSSLVFGDDSKSPETAPPKGGVLSEKARTQALVELTKVADDNERQEMIGKVYEAAQKTKIQAPKIITKSFVVGPDGKMVEITPQNAPASELAELLEKGEIEELAKRFNEKPSVTTKSFVVGPDGKMIEVDPKKNAAPDLEELLKKGNFDGMEKLFQNPGVAVSGKIVVVGEDGKVIEKELAEGQDINDLIQGAIGGKGLEAVDLSELYKLLGEASILGVGRPSVLENPTKTSELQSLKADLKKVREEMKSQRKLLEKILKKLD